MTGEQPSYGEVKPSPPLVPYVQCYWSITAASAPPVLNRICPDGCADIIVDLSATLAMGGAPGVGRLLRGGTMLRAARILWPAPFIYWACVSPGAAGSDLRPADARAHRQNGSASGSVERGDRPRPCLAEAPTHSDRVARLERFLLARLRRVREPAPVVRQAIRFVARTGGTRSVRELEQVVGLGGRHLERHFRDAVGISPKSFARVIRFGEP